MRIVIVDTQANGPSASAPWPLNPKSLVKP